MAALSVKGFLGKIFCVERALSLFLMTDSDGESF
jgi:hypothetical protein